MQLSPLDVGVPGLLTSQPRRRRSRRDHSEDYARRAAEYDTAAVRRGRRSLTGGSIHSPRVSFRVPESLRTAAEEAAAREGKSVSELAREALEQYLAS